MISIRYPRTRKHKTPTKKWKLLCQLIAIWYATTITTSFIDGSTGAYFNDQDHVTGIITAGTWSIWDNSSLNFPDKENRTVNSCTPVDISARITNTGSSMEGTTEYAVYHAASGNPKNGSSVFNGDIQPINEGETATLIANVNQPGNYKFKGLQRPDHGNKEDIRQELWSETITIKCEQEKTEAPDKGGDDKKPETPGNKDKKDKEIQEVSVPAPTTEPSEENKKEETPPKEEKQPEPEPEQPATPVEPEQETEEEPEVKAASEQIEAPPPKRDEPSVPSTSSEITSTKE
ncbi:amyloid fiber anchoring/assembly protein TapA [Rossellomorea vietnamensis]|uniref:amyloid fiber anchoring/assembly protein TapA n=1 Tax=Rossellomorea vietnamensis TaxID=218284 RepID=UPI003D2D9E9F